MHWKRNLAVIWLAQFLSISGFAFCMPFAPFYIQELGVHDPVKIKMWVAAFAAATPMGLAIFAPVWGAVADRYGRRLMLLRANLGAALVLYLMGLSHSVALLVGLRVLQGMLTGTVTAAQTIVASGTPENRSGLALGALSAAIFSGMMAGSALGGLCAEAFGYRATFAIAAGILLIAALVVLLGTSEQFDRKAGDVEREPLFQWRIPRLGGAWMILLVTMAVAGARQFDMAFVPLLVQEINGSLDGASAWTGHLFAAGGVAGLLSGIVMGQLTDRLSTTRLAAGCALGAGLMMFPQGLAHGFGALFGARFAMMFCAGALDPILQVWLVRTTPEHRRGFIFGWAATARSIGWIMAPLASGALASVFGIRSIFFAGGVAFLLLIPLVRLAERPGRSGRRFRFSSSFASDPPRPSATPPGEGNSG
jgi:MFS transporter, DHA1 family, multidrug resistance protein